MNGVKSRIIIGGVLVINESATIIKITYPNGFYVRSKATSQFVKEEDINNYKAFITGMHMFFLDYEDHIISK